MSKSDRAGAAVTRRRKGIDYRLFLRCLRPELADRILGQDAARTEVPRRQRTKRDGDQGERDG